MARNSTLHTGSKSEALLLKYFKSCKATSADARSKLRETYKQADILYHRTSDQTKANLRAKAANKAGNVDRLQNITVPVVMPTVLSAVQKQANTFLSGTPLFPVVAAPEYMDGAMQMDTILENQSERGAWKKELLAMLLNCFKYNLGAVEVSWEKQVNPKITTSATDTSKSEVSEAIWSGNVLKNLDVYNLILDPTVNPADVSESGEFSGHEAPITRMELKRRIAAMPSVISGNINKAFNSGSIQINSSSEGEGYYHPQITDRVDNASTVDIHSDWDVYMNNSDGKGKEVNYGSRYLYSVLYARVLPTEFDLKVANAKTPQIVKLVIINHQVVLYAEFVETAIDRLPIFIGNPNFDIGYQSKGVGEDAAVFQEVASGLMASVMASKRRAINDRMFYDPSRVSKTVINSPNPSAKMPVRSKAYGSKISDAVYAIPYREETDGSTMQQMSSILEMGGMLSSQNKTSQGQFVKGNKSVKEFETTMEAATSRDALYSVTLEAQVFQPMKQMFKTNILQFQGADSLYSDQTKQQVDINPIKLRQAALKFKVADGLTPSETVVNAETFSTFMQYIATDPALRAEYNIAPMMSYMAKTQGADLSPFEKSPQQVAYEQAVQSWQQVMIAAIEKGESMENMPPQPLPEQYKYDPNVQVQASSGEQVTGAKSEELMGILQEVVTGSIPNPQAQAAQ